MVDLRSEERYDMCQGRISLFCTRNWDLGLFVCVVCCFLLGDLSADVCEDL